MSLLFRLLLGMIFAVQPVVAQTASDDLRTAVDQLAISTTPCGCKRPGRCAEQRPT